jgi:hypothetical protein
MKGYKKPRRFNLVSFLLIVAAIAAIYCVFQFGPPYWRKWKVKEVLSNNASRLYPKRLLVVAGTANELVEEIRKRTADDLRSAGVEDPGLRVNITVANGQIVVSADYRERIRHPFVGKSTTLRFHPRAEVQMSAPSP